MTSLLLLWCALAHADPAADLRQASDSDLPEGARMEAFERLVRTGTTDISLVSQVCAESEDTRERWVACRVLGQVGGARARDILVALLSDGEPAMRTAAAQALGDAGDPSVAPQLLPLLQDPAVIVRSGAAEALGKLKAESAVEALSSALFASDSYHRGQSMWVRRHYVDALGSIGHNSAVPALLKAMDDADEQVAAATVPAFEGVAGFSYGEGRSTVEERQAWRRWAQSQVQ